MDGRVFADIVNQLLALHGIQRPFGGHRDLTERCNTRIEAQGTEIGMVGHMEWQSEALVTDGRNTQHENALRHVVDFKNTVHVTDATFDEFVVDGVEYSQIDVWQKLTRFGIAQHTRHRKSVAAREHGREGALAGTVWTHNGVRLTIVDDEVDAFQYLFLANASM